ncbi:hypothetical protein ABFX02_10G040300 [Erythranthe guttata]
MNSLTNLIHFPSPRKRLLHLLPRTAVQHCNFFSAKTTVSSSQKVQQLTNPKPHKSSDSSSFFAQRINKKTEAAAISVWPEPRKMPYQAKVANFVNLIGYVEIPVQFDSDSDGKHFATTIISVGNGGGRKSPLSIPVVFEGELAHVVACHVKENNCVFVSGQLSVDPMRLVLGDSVGKFHVVAENLSFVEGFEKHVVDKKTGASFSPVEIYNPDKHGFKLSDGEVLENVDDEDVDSDESILEMGNEKSGEYVNKKKTVDEILDLWRVLVKNPQQWWDYRSHKLNGLVKEKFPDFKQKGTGESLWVNTAPKWVLTGLGLLEFDVKDMKPKQVMGGEGCNERKTSGKSDDSWKDLVENPDKWWDNRTKKKNPKAPDFRHKETGEVLWLNGSPAWASSRIPTA